MMGYDFGRVGEVIVLWSKMWGRSMEMELGNHSCHEIRQIIVQTETYVGEGSSLNYDENDLLIGYDG
ncbi:MAG: hypothetical protein R3C14_46235 [Caldilineaceae bacterium]